MDGAGVAQHRPDQLGLAGLALGRIGRLQLGGEADGIEGAALQAMGVGLGQGGHQQVGLVAAQLQGQSLRRGGRRLGRRDRLGQHGTRQGGERARAHRRSP